MSNCKIDRFRKILEKYTNNTSSLGQVSDNSAELFLEAKDLFTESDPSIRVLCLDIPVIQWLGQNTEALVSHIPSIIRYERKEESHNLNPKFSFKCDTLYIETKVNKTLILVGDFVMIFPNGAVEPLHHEAAEAFARR